MNRAEQRWQDSYRQGDMYAWWQQQDEAHLWAPLGHPDRQMRYLVAEVLRLHTHPHPVWLTELTGRAIDACGLNLPAVRQYIAEHAPQGEQLSSAIVCEAYRRETLHRHWGWVWRAVTSA